MARETINTPREQTHQRIADALEDIVDKMVDTSSASNVNYDNAQSGLSANKVQGAVDELASEKADKSTTLAGYGITDAYTKAEVYTQSEVNNIVSTLETNIDWKEAVNTYADIATTYPNPQDGWTVNVKDTDYTYRYNGSEWVAISANAIPEATTSVKGLMTPTQVSKLNGIEAGAQVNTVTSVAGKTGAVTLTKSDVGLGNVDNTSDLDKPISTAAQTALNNKVDKATGKGLSTNDYTNEEKQKNADNASAIEDIQEDISQSLTATGNPLTIEAAEANLVECVAEVETVQDLHGYDYPWVGGAGKNKWDEETIYGYRLIENGLYFRDTNELCSKNLIPVSPSTSYRLVRGGNSVITYNSNQEFISGFFVSTGEIFTTPSDCYYIHFNLGSSYGNVYNHDVGVIYPSSEMTYSPYTNICPISGRSEVAIQRVGKNLLNNTATTTTTGGVTYTVNQDKTISCSNTATGVSNITIISNATLKAGSYILTGCPSGGGMETMRLHAYRTNGGYLGFDIGSGAEFTLENDINDLNVEIRIGSGVNANGKIFKPMIRLSTETDPTYEPYKGKTYTIQLGDTIYGGELDVVKGELRVTHGYVEYSSAKGTGAGGTFTFDRPQNMNADVSDAEVAHLTSDKLKAYSISNIVFGEIIGIAVSRTSGVIYARFPSSYGTTTSDIDAKLAVDPLQVVYELAEPYTIQLTPQQIRLLKGTNNISCNTGDLSIKYYPDNVLGQLKGDIEDEYDERIETLETQMVERPQLKRYSTRLLCDGFSSKNISITTDKKIISLFARFDAEYTELYIDYEPRFYNPLVYYDDGEAYINYQTSGIPNDNQQRTFEMYYYEV